MTKPTTAAARRARISELLASTDITSQDDLRRRLLAEGIAVTQATVSRDLEALGAVKRHAPDGSVRYEIVTSSVSALAGPGRQGWEALVRVATETLLDAEAAVNIAVLRTPPGAAHYLAGFVDRTSVEGVVGSVAGDDTVIVVMTGAEVAAQFCERLVRLASAGAQERRSS